MDLTSAFLNIHWLSVLVAALSSFFLGGLWYGPLFGKTWMTAFILKMVIGKKAGLLTGLPS
jgi:hypothetical protein